ncbi:NEDD4-binding protein 2-like [Oncorhynchus nerka]|uniref:NEDD4-binding protein 2-like n=1 Tax=Oncorhynchus nerka TaxID=8023 RepID=UPI0031B8A864
MPRKKKNGHSPARVPGLSNDNNYYRIPGTSDGAPLSRSEFHTGTNSHDYGSTNMLVSTNSGGISATSQDKDEIVRTMKEMFYHLDPEVLYIVLAECDFKVENAMDSLLELSVAAERVGPLPPLLSGFELTAALLSPQHNSSKPDLHPHPPTGESAVPLSPPRRAPPLRSEDNQDLTTDLTEEFDVLIDRELENLTLQQEAEARDHGDLHSSSSSVSSLSFPVQPPGAQQQALPQPLQSSPRASASRRGLPGDQPCPDRVFSAGQASGPHSPVSDLSLNFSGGAAGYRRQRSLLDFSHLTSSPSETDRTKPSLLLDPGAADRPSAFQAYRKLDQFTVHPEGERTVPPGGVVRGARTKTSVAGEEERLNNPSFWNTRAPEFQPHVRGNQATGPAFIVPVALSPSSWHTRATPASHWLAQGPVGQAATVPRSWTGGVSAGPRAPLLSGQHGRLRLEGHVLVLLRGAPGSGKSTLARAMLEQNPHGVVLSTDDYFCRHGDYRYDPSALGEAHEWNHARAQEVMEASFSPVVIDNTNIRTRHSVKAEKIRWMMENYDRHVTIHSIMGALTPNYPHYDPTRPPITTPNYPPNRTQHDPPSRRQTTSPTGPNTTPHHDAKLPPQQDPSPTHQEAKLPPNRTQHDPHHDAKLLPQQDPSPPHQEAKLPPNRTQAQPIRRPNYPPTGPKPIPSGGQTTTPSGGQTTPHQEAKLPPIRRPNYPPIRGQPAPIRRPNYPPSGGQTTPHQEAKLPPIRRPNYHPIRRPNYHPIRRPNYHPIRRPNYHPIRRPNYHPIRRLARHSKFPQHTQTASQTTPQQETRDRAQVSDKARRDLVGEQRLVQGSERSCPSSPPRFPTCRRPAARESHNPGSQLCPRVHSVEAGEGSHVGEVSQCTDASETRMEGEVGHLGGGSEERRQSRRAEKQCKLALTFTNNTPPSPKPQTDPDLDPNSDLAPNLDSDLDPNSDLASNLDSDLDPNSDLASNLDSDLDPNSDLAPNLDSDLDPNSDLAPNLDSDLDPNSDLAPNLDSDLDPNLHSDLDPNLHSDLDPNLHSDLDPNLHSDLDPNLHSDLDPNPNSDLDPNLHSDLDPNLPSDLDPNLHSDLHSRYHGGLGRRWVHPSGQRGGAVLTHEKGSQVEERELEEGRTRQQNLVILRRHFKLVNRHTLEDLYDTCQQDLEWTSNLLLDSGERLFLEEEEDEEEGDGDLDMAVGVSLEERTERRVTPPGEQASASSFFDSEAIVVLGRREEEEETWRTGGGVDEGVGGVSGLYHPVSGGGGGSEEQNTPLGESTRLEHGPPGRDVAEQEVVRDSESGADAEQWEREEEEGDEVTQSLLAQLEEMERREEEEERKGRKEKEKRRDRLVDIQSVELKLPTELALQLVELFGPVGVLPGLCSPDDYSVRMDLNMARLLHQKWKDTVQEKQRQAALSYHLLQE